MRFGVTDKLYREIEEAKALRLYLASVIKGDTEEDQQTLQDTFDGEAESLKDAIRAAYLSMVEDQVSIIGINVVVAELKARQERLEKRESATRGRILQALTVAGWDKLPLDVATLSCSKAQDKVVVDEENEIPTQFWKRGDPVLDKAALAKAVKERQKVVDELAKKAMVGSLEILELPPPIPGCHLEVGGRTLTVRKA